jgi:hypothetical protein
MVTHVWFTVYLFVTAFVMAKLEVQIEGPAGWADNLPTWRVENRVTRRILGGRAMTGYHVYFQLLIFALLHAPFALGIAALTLATELRVLAVLILFWLLEDWLWFVVNPAYGLRHFKPDRVRWHRESWWWVMPREYWIAAPVGIALYVLSWTV